MRHTRRCRARAFFWHTSACTPRPDLVLAPLPAVTRRGATSTAAHQSALPREEPVALGVACHYGSLVAEHFAALDGDKLRQNELGQELTVGDVGVKFVDSAAPYDTVEIGTR